MARDLSGFKPIAVGMPDGTYRYFGPAPSCRHCGQEVRQDCSTVYMGGGPPTRWLHIGSGFLCDPQDRESPRAEPEED